MALNINGTTGISGVDGSASAPALQGTDSNTGINFGSDTVNINTGGTTRATIDSAGALDVPTNFPIKVNGSEKLRIDSSGNVGIGKTPSDRLDVQTTHASGGRIATFYNSDSGNNGGLIIQGGGSDGEARLQTAGGNSFITFYTEGGDLGERMRIDSSGNVLVGRTSTITVNGNTSNATFEQHINGSWPVAVHTSQTAKRGYAAFYAETGDGSSSGDHFAYFANQTNSKFLIFGNGDVDNRNNSYGQISDETLKQDIVDAASQWNDIKNLRVRKFRFKDNPTGVLQIGVVAQEVETVSAGLVKTDDEGIKSVKYSVLYMKAVKALQEAQARIETLEAEKTQMKTDLTALTARVTALEAG
jgi:hypothetical protein